jgi:hypothetical protein
MKEIVINMIGAERFGIYIVDEDEHRLLLVAQEGLDGREGETVPLQSDARAARVARSGEIYAADSSAGPPADGEPVAVFPLKIDDRLMGVIVLEALLTQKDGLQALDYELFELLGKHAATAMYGARLFTVSERKRNTLEGFVQLLKPERRPVARSR